MKVILLGSGKNMVKINDWDTSSIDKIVGVNNVWKGTDKWNILIHAGDYPYKNLIPRSGKEVYSVDTEKSYRHSYIEMTAAGGNQKLPWHKARIHLGLPIYFTVTYWTLYYLKPTHIGFLGFDMNYTPDSDGATTFYGKGYDMQTRGVPDPLFQFRKFYRDLKDPMGTLMDRLDDRRGSTQLYNLSDDPESVLKWDKISFSDFRKL